MRTVKLDNGKYEFDVDEQGIFKAARRNGEEWRAGLAYAGYKAFCVALQRIIELEDEIRRLTVKP
jgi:hypothetical protein